MSTKVNNFYKRFRYNVHEVVFEAGTPLGKFFDVSLMILILLSLVIVMLDSIVYVRKGYGNLLNIAEWTITILFTIEYFVRIWVVNKPMRYIKSYFGIIDLLAILPTYLSLILVGPKYLAVLRILRLLRVFRIFKLTHYMDEGKVLISALRASKAKITVFLVAVLAIVTILGSFMYVIEGGQDSGFTSIPQSIYWAIVTMTTVGYGDIAPVTVAGKFLASVVMIMGYGIIAVPTGIVSVEFARADQMEKQEIGWEVCPDCSGEGHDEDAKYCKFCGGDLFPLSEK